MTGIIGGVIAALALPAFAHAQTSPSGGAAPATASENPMAALARASQNPVADLYSLPFQNNTNFNVGPGDDVQNVLNIQPVIPISVTENWNVVTRTILPIVSQPGLTPGQDRTFGLGPTLFTAFLAPSKPGKLIWGVGPALQIPTTTDKTLGSNIWGAGPSAVALTSQGQWVIGAVASNVWSFGGNDRTRYNTFTAQPFVNYNIKSSPGTYVSFSPIITANWEADSDDVWTVPLGLAVGQVLPIGKQPVNIQLGSYYNVVRPDLGPDWQIRFQVALLFPK